MEAAGMPFSLFLFLAVFTVLSSAKVYKETKGIPEKYAPTWDSLDKRPIPSWYDKGKFGIFMHWGVYSVPSFGSEWFWKYFRGGVASYVDFVKKNYPPGFKYPDFAPMFHAEFFDPNQWADLLAKSGAKYYVLTSKHHEGFTNWPSKDSWNWNSVDTGPHRDLVGDLAKAIRTRTNVTFGLYFSLYEWYHPYYMEDAQNTYHTQKYVDEIVLPQLYDIINTYQPEYLWTDGDWEASSSYWKATDFLAWLYNESPVKDTVVVNDRWGNDTRCKHGGVYTCEDRFDPGKLLPHKFEDATTADKSSWGYRRNMNYGDVRTTAEIVGEMAKIVSCGGNYLLNVGPTSDGRIATIFQERLIQTGEWLAVNGEAIYETKPWRVQNDTVNPDVWYTNRPDLLSVYAISLTWPTTNMLKLGAPMTSSETRVTLLGYEGNLAWHPYQGGMVIEVPDIPVSLLPCKWAWVFKLTHVT